MALHAGRTVPLLPRSHPWDSDASAQPFDRWEGLAVALVLAVGVFLRVYRLGELPPGLHQDEAVYGLHSLTVALGQFRIFFGEREPLYMYLVAGMSLLLGPTAFALRVTSALVGSAAVLTTYLAARSLFGRRPALLAGATMAATLWPVMISRLGFRAGTLPLLETAALYFLWDGWRRGSRWRSALGGVLLGGTLYTYIASRFFPVALAAFLLAQLLVDRSFFRQRLAELGLALAAAAATFAPLGYYFWRHPEAFFGRPEQVSAVDSQMVSVAGLRELAINAGRTVGMFFVAGDANWRHNLSGEPALLPPVAVLLVVGYALALARFRRPAHLLLVLWLPVMLVPSALSIDAPHYLRTIGAAPAAAMAVGVGLSTVVDALLGLLRGPTSPPAPSPLAERGRDAQLPPLRLRRGGEGEVSVLLCLLFALAPAVATFRDYQVVWASRPEVYEAFNVGLASAGQYLAGSDLWRSGRGTVYVTSQFYADRASMTFFLWPYLSNADRLAWNEASLRVKWFDEGRALPIPASGEALYITSASAERPGLGEELASAGLRGEIVQAPPLGLPAFGAYRRPAGTPALPERPLLARSQAGLDLVGYRPAGPTPSGQTATLALYWRVAGKPPESTPSVFAHLIDDAGHGLASDDQVLGYAPAQWAPGDTIVTWHRLAIPPGLPPGAYAVEVGLYDKATGRRQPLGLEDRVDSRALVGPIEVTRGAASPADVKPAQRVDLPVAPDLRLLGLDRGVGPVAPGAWVPLTLYWQATGAPPDYLVELGLLDGEGRELGVQRVRPTGGRYPTRRWRPGEVVRDDLDLRVEATTPAGSYAAFLRVLTAAGARVGQASLGPVQVVGQPRLFDAPSPRQALRATFGDVAELVGYDLATDPARPGGKVRLTLYWRALGETRDAYTVFTHLIDGAEHVWGQQDNPPARGARPTTGWVSGEFVVDEYEIPVAPEAPAGEYRVEVGMYDPATGRRLAVCDERGEGAGDRVLLGQGVRVQ